MTNPDKTIMAHLAAAHALADDQRLMREEHFGGSACKDDADWVYYAYLTADIDKTLTDIPQAERQALARAMETVIDWAGQGLEAYNVPELDTALETIGVPQ